VKRIMKNNLLGVMFEGKIKNHLYDYVNIAVCSIQKGARLSFRFCKKVLSAARALNGIDYRERMGPDYKLWEQYYIQQQKKIYIIKKTKIPICFEDK